jgi:hypothetical protein
MIGWQGVTARWRLWLAPGVHLICDCKLSSLLPQGPMRASEHRKRIMRGLADQK